MIYLLLAVFALSLGLTWCLRSYALAKNIIDVPNHRSSHVIPTPRGGGVAFIVVVLMAIPLVIYLGIVPVPISVALMGAGLFVAALGFLDDHGHVPAHFRLMGHFTASIFAVYCLGGMPPIVILGWDVPAGWVLSSVAVVYLVWVLNLYNFMDGIDGLAAVEAICVCLSGAFLYWLNGDYAVMSIPLIIAAAVAGFLWWNFPPARIFMGDAGSGFLGLVLGILSIQAASINPQFFWCWLILLGVFVVDATMTLLRHLFLRIKLYEAHRDHAYQHAVRRFDSHIKVTCAILLINIVWLLPMAILTNQWPLNGFVGLVFAYIPLVILAFRFKVGLRD